MRGFIDLLLGLIHKGHKRKDPAEEREKVKASLIVEVDTLGHGVNDSNLGSKSRAFFKVVRKSFRNLFSIKYECTFEELKKEISSKPMKDSVKSEARVFLEEMERLEYGFSDLKQDYRDKKVRERQQMMVYLNELELEGKKVDKKLRKELNSLFKADVSDDSKLLIKKINEFKLLLKKL